MSDLSKALVPYIPLPQVHTAAAQQTTLSNFEGLHLQRRSSRAPRRQGVFRHPTQSTPPFLFFGSSTSQPISISFTPSGLVVMNGSPNNNNNMGLNQGQGFGQGHLPNGFQPQPTNYPQLTSGGGFQQQQPNTGYHQGQYYDPRQQQHQQMQTPNQNHNHFHGSSFNFFFMGSGSFDVRLPPQGQGQGQGLNAQQQQHQQQINPPNNYGHSQGNYFQPQNGYGHHSHSHHHGHHSQRSGSIRQADYSPPTQTGGVAYPPSANNLRRSGSLASLDTTSDDFSHLSFLDIDEINANYRTP